MVPEYSKAALGLHPLIPAYAVNCHAEKNKPLCAEQGVNGYPALMYYSGGRVTEYLGGRRFEQLKAFTEKASAP